MPFKDAVDPKTGQSYTVFVEDVAPKAAAPKAAPAAPRPKPQQQQDGGGFQLPDIGDLGRTIAKEVVDTIAPGASNVGAGIQAGLTTAAKTGDLNKSIQAAGKAFVSQSTGPTMLQRQAINAPRNIIQEPVNVVADLTGRPTTAAKPDAPFPGLNKPLPKIAPKLGQFEEFGTNLLQGAIEVMLLRAPISLAGKGLQMVPGVAKGVQAVTAGREAALGAVKAVPVIGGLASKTARVATRAFSPEAMATGGIIDAVGFNPHGGRLYDLTVGTPLELPALSYLKSQPGDVGAKARLKNGLEGLFIVGPAQEVLMSAFRAAKYVGRAESAGPDVAPGAAQQATDAVDEFRQKATDFANSGRPPEEAAPAPAPAAAAPTPTGAPAPATPSVPTAGTPAPAAAAPTAPSPAASAAVTVAQQRYDQAQSKLTTLGPAPAKPSSESKTFGAGGIANADPAAVARWKLETKAYQSWNRKYLGLKKEEVAASNQLFEAKKKLEAAAPEAPVEQPAAPTAAPFQVEAYRGLKEGVDPTAPGLGGGRFFAPDEALAQQYAGPGGQVVKETLTFNNPLVVADKDAARNALGLSSTSKEASVISVAKEQGYDGIVFENINQRAEYVDLRSPTAPAPAPAAAFADPLSAENLADARLTLGLPATANLNAITTAAREQGYDAIQWTGTAGTPGGKGGEIDLRTPAVAAEAQGRAQPPQEPVPSAAEAQPIGPEPVQAAMPDDAWVTKLVDAVQANREAIDRGDVTWNDLLENNVQRIQSRSGSTQYVVKNPDMVMGYKAFSDILSREDATGIPVASQEQIATDTADWLERIGYNKADVLEGLKLISDSLSNYQENLRSLRAGQMLVDYSNLQAGIAATQWLNSAAGGALDRNQLAAQLFAAAAAQKQANVALEKITRPIGQLLWSLQNPRPEPGSIPFREGEPSGLAGKDIQAEMETAMQVAQDAPVADSIGGTLSPETVEAINAGDYSNPKVQAEVDQLAMVLSSGAIDPTFARNFWTNLPGNVALGARGLNMLHASFLVSSGETMITNLLNGVIRLIDLPVTTAAGAAMRGDLSSAGTALQMLVGYKRFLVGAAKIANHSFRLGRGFYDVSHQSVDMLERLANQEAISSTAGIPAEMERAWTINDTPLIDATDKSPAALAVRATWRTITGPLRVMTAADTFIKALAGDSFEFAQNLRPGLERAVDLGMVPGSPEAWKWANQYAEQVVKAKKRDLIVEGKTITDAIMTSPNALNAARYATFTDDVWAEMEWNMPNPATGKPMGRSFERGAELAAAKGITDPEEITKFAEDYLKGGTFGENVSEAAMGTVGRTFSVIPQAYTLLSQNARVGVIFQAIQPFIRTPFDIGKSMARKGPGSILVDTWWRDLNSSNQMIRDKAVGDIGTGAAAFSLLALAMASGNVRFNGAGPLDSEAKRKWMADGRMPFSFQMRAGTDPGGMPKWGESITLRLFEPYTSIMGGMADYLGLAGNLSTEAKNRLGSSMVADVLARSAVGQLSKQYFTGLYDVVDAIMGVGEMNDGPNVRNSLNKYLSKLAAGYAVPSAFASGRRIMDPIARQVQPGSLFQETLDEIKNRLPGWSKDIPAVVDWVTGEDVVMAGIYGQQHIPADQQWLGILYQYVPWSPLKVRSPAHNVLQEMGALHGKGANFKGPSANDYGAELRLDSNTFNAYKREVATVVRDEAGRTLTEALDEEIKGPQYQALPFDQNSSVVPMDRVAQLSIIIGKFKAMGKESFLNRPENATLLRQVNERQARLSAVGQGQLQPMQSSWSPTPR